MFENVEREFSNLKSRLYTVESKTNSLASLSKVDVTGINHNVVELTADVTSLSAQIRYLDEQLKNLKIAMVDLQCSIDSKYGELRALMDERTAKPKQKNDLEIFDVNIENILDNVLYGDYINEL